MEAALNRQIAYLQSLYIKLQVCVCDMCYMLVTKCDRWTPREARH